MKVEALSLTHFRNLTGVIFLPSPSVNLIYGANGSGKTSLLEAMWLCTGLRSFRDGNRRQAIQFGEPFFRISLDFTAFGRPQKIEYGYSRTQNQHKYALNGVKKSAASAFSGAFCSVVFSPDHMELIGGSPEERRRFLDNAISQIRPHYADLCLKYQKCLQQRNHLLRKTGGQNQVDRELLEIWDESLVGFGAAIMEYRFAYVKGLSERTSFFYGGISGDREKLTLQYQSAVPIPKGAFSIQEVSASYRKKLSENLSEDQRLGYTGVGIHREDLKIELDSHSIRFYGSQGQKRSAVIAMKLAEADEIARNIGEEPVIFLDDVLSELDENRQRYILAHIENRQVFITGCDPIRLPKSVGGASFLMKDGQIGE